VSGTLAADLATIMPEAALTLAGVVIVLLDALWPRLARYWVPSAAVIVGAVAALAWSEVGDPVTSWGGFLERSPATVFLTLVLLLSAFLALAASQSYLRREGILGGEYASLVLWCLVGLLLLVRSTELLTLFLSLELLSFCLYALAAYHRRLKISIEAGLKYFLMGAFVSAFILLGIALLYGETGATRFDEIAGVIEGGGSSITLVSIGLLLVLGGFAFKLSLVPFHAWSPDVYQGAPSPFGAFLSVAPKLAAAWVMYRLLHDFGFVGGDDRWGRFVVFLAVASILLGNLLALVQKDIKRMLAYSGIAHMGYLAIPLVVADGDALAPVLLYGLAYALMNAGAFVVVSLLYARAGEQHLLSELSGWGYRFPFLAAGLTICLLSLAGIPPTLGFVSKYVVFSHAIENGHLGLAIVAIAGSLVGVYYYMRVVYVLYMKPEIEAPSGLLIDTWGRLSVAVAAGGTVILGIWPGRLLDWLTSLTGP